MEAAQPAQGSSLLNKLGELEAKYLPRPPKWQISKNNNALCSELPESEKAIWYIDEKTIGASSENDSNFYDLYPGQAVAERKDKNPARREASIVEMGQFIRDPGAQATRNCNDLRLKREATKSKNESSDFRGLSQVEIACSLPRHERRPGSSVSSSWIHHDPTVTPPPQNNLPSRRDDSRVGTACMHGSGQTGWSALTSVSSQYDARSTRPHAQQGIDRWVNPACMKTGGMTAGSNPRLHEDGGMTVGHPNCWSTDGPTKARVNNLTTAGRIEKSRSATKAQPEFADTMAPRTPVNTTVLPPEAGRLKSIFRGDSRFQMGDIAMSTLSAPLTRGACDSDSQLRLRGRDGTR
ncbi:hypothetical protein PGT21_023433 [Puccinia graminis f. sp. tritici]|uniref:Uncharacterized protein n=1 Tax=Puccinia graminis f. sp. tritici TaxID=56615 RepID=A0A5B0M2I7_PUCGR|nr:hypothetical protein PGT21_023433 [Puccinia graminis f. sp. tritici]